MTAAHADYQERRKGSRMQLSRSETILIRNRPPKPSETPPVGRLSAIDVTCYCLSAGASVLVQEEEQPEESPSAAELLRSSGGKGGKQKGKKGAKAAEGSRRRQMSLVQYGLRWHAVRHLYDVILNSRLPGESGPAGRQEGGRSHRHFQLREGLMTRRCLRMPRGVSAVRPAGHVAQPGGVPLHPPAGQTAVPDSVSLDSIASRVPTVHS